jgi:hypothetical protein
VLLVILQRKRGLLNVRHKTIWYDRSSGDKIDLQDLWLYISRFAPDSVELEPALKCFLPDFIPSVGDIDPIIKVRRAQGLYRMLGSENSNFLLLDPGTKAPP